MDDVEGLGVFIEAEQLAEDNADSQPIAEELWTVLEKFNVSRSDEVFEGYDVLLNRKNSQQGG